MYNGVIVPEDTLPQTLHKYIQCSEKWNCLDIL